MYWQSYNSILRSLSLSSQGNTKQQTTLSIAFLSLASDLYTNICKRDVPTQQMHSHGAAGRSTCGRGSHDVSLYAPPVSLATWVSPTLSRHGLTVPCSRGTLLSILPYPLLYFNHVFSFRSEQMTTVHKEHRSFTKTHRGPLGTAVLWM